MCGEGLAGVQQTSQELTADSGQQLRVCLAKLFKQEAHRGGCQVPDRPVVVLCSAAKLLGHNTCEEHRDYLLQVIVQHDLLILQQGPDDLHDAMRINPTPLNHRPHGAQHSYVKLRKPSSGPKRRGEAKGSP